MTQTTSPSMRRRRNGHQRIHSSPPGLARGQIKVHYKPEVHANFNGAHIRQVEQRLRCLAKDPTERNFWLKQSGKDLELLLTAAEERVTVVLPSVQILPQNSEHQLFLMPPAA